MPTNIDKALNRVPEGVGAPETDMPGMESLLVELPDEAELEDDSEEELTEPDFDANLAETMEDGPLSIMAGDLSADIDNDKNSRRDWEETYIEGLKLLGLKYEERTEPWNGACGVTHPLITEAVVRFQSETITETFPAAGPVKSKIIGKETPDKLKAAKRVEEDMNYQLTERMVEYRPEHDKMLWSLPSTGSAFKKIYYDPNLGRQIAVFIPAEDILMPYGTSDIHSCYRVTHVMRKTKNEVRKLQQAGFYRDVDLPDPDKMKDNIKDAKDDETGFRDLNDDRYTLYECHVDLDLKGFEDKDEDGEETGIALPYVVTLIRGTNTVLSIRRNWEESDPLKLKRQHFVHYQYVPGFGAYGYGLFHLIGGYAKSATSLMRQLVDAGTLSNLPGGLKARGLRIKGDDTPISPGEFRDVDVGSGTIRDNIMPLPYKEPSNTLFQLLGAIVEEGRRFASTADVKISDMSAQAPVGTTLALLERQLTVMTAVQARVHYTLKQEFGLLKGIIRDYAPDDYEYDPETDTPQAKKTDYEMVDVIPVSDPNSSTMAQRIIQWQAVIQLAQMSPDIYNMPLLHRGMLDVLGVKNSEKLVPLPEDMKPVDPVTENMNILKLEPVKAFLHQDHEAHIQVHMAAAQDPIIQQLVGQGPKANEIAAAHAAHVAEHVGFAYRKKIEAQLGIALPPVSEDEPMPPEVETALSGMMAQAAQQVLQQSQQQAAKAQAEQQAQDPVLQMQMMDLQIKDKKRQDDKEIAQARLQLDAQELAAKYKLEGFKTGRAAKQAEDKMAVDAHAKGVQIGADLAKHKADVAVRKEQVDVQRMAAKNRPKPKGD